MAAAKKKTAKKSAKKKKSSLGAKKKGEGKKASSKAKTYEPSAKFKVGDLVFHEKWADEGPVVETGKTEDGTEKVVVDFEEVGLKHLVMNYDLKI